MSIKLPETTIKGIAVNERIGRIAVDAVCRGRQVSVVIEPGQVPAKVKTPEQMQAYLLAQVEKAAGGAK